jgi:type IV pilus assembly protein PilW
MSRGQKGFTMIELLVALSIGLFLLGGLLTLVQDNRRTFSSQNQMSMLQDNERMAMTMMTDVIQAAGYFPNPSLYTASSWLPAAGALAQGQAMTGTYSAAAPGDTITARYATNSGDGILNCSGGSNASGGVLSYTNAFSVVNGQLICTMNGTVYPLVGAATGTPNQISVTQLSVLYGVNSAGNGNNVDSYMTAAQVTANGDWNNVISMQITLTFTNPLFVVGQGQPLTIAFQRDIGVMNKVGI